MDEGFDTGDIIAQKRVSVYFHDTGESLYHRLEHACVELFKETWPEIKSGKNLRMQQASAGIYHSKGDIALIDNIDLEKKYQAKELINILRARTFYPYRGAFVKVGGKKIFLRLELNEADQEK